MKYVIVWKSEYSCGIVKKDGAIVTFRKPETALKFALERAQQWKAKNSKRDQIQIDYYEPNEYEEGRVCAYDTDDVHCPADNWVYYYIDGGK